MSYLLSATFFTLHILLKIWDFVTYPVYWIIQKPDQALSTVRKAGAKVTRLDSRTIRIDSFPCSSASNDYITGDKCDGTLNDFMEWMVNRSPNRICMGKRKILGYQPGIYNGKQVTKISRAPHYDRITFSQLRQRYEHLSIGLMKHLSLKKGDKVAIYANTRMEWMLSALAILKAGGTIVTLYTTMSLEVIANCLQQTMPSIIVSESALLDKVFKLLGSVPEMKDVKVVNLDQDQTEYQCVTLSEIESVGKDNYLPFPEVKKDDTAMIMYTSGTTHKSKGVIMQHQQILAAVGALSISGDKLTMCVLPEGSNLVCYLPLAHIFEFTQEIMAMGMGFTLDYGTPYSLTNNSPTVVPGELGDFCASKPHYVVMVPLVADKIKAAIEKIIAQKGVFVSRLLEFCVDYKTSWTKQGFRTPILDKLIFSKIRAVFGGKIDIILVGGARLSPDVQRFFRAVLGTAAIAQGHGATETCGTSFGQPRETDAEDEIGFNTPPVPTMIESWEEGGYTIHDEQGPAGEIIIGGKNIASGYYQHDDPTDISAFFTDSNGHRWFRSGDIGRLNTKTNAVTIIDRKRQLIKLPNGEYISLARIESEICLCKYVDNACVFTKPDSPSLVAVVVPDMQVCLELNQGNEDVTSDTHLLQEKLLAVIDQFLKNRLASYEIPKAICLVDGPWTPEGGLVTGALKTKRKVIGQRYEEEITAMFNSLEK